jgi:hypothetical protein
MIAIPAALSVASPASAQGTLAIQSGSSLSLSNYTAFVAQIGTTLAGNPQGSGAFTATQSGTIGIQTLDLAANQMTLSTSGTNIISSNSGIWQPAVGGGTGTAPANYGATGSSSIFTGLSAFRNSQLTLTQSGPSGTQGPALPAPNAANPTVSLTPTGTGTWSFTATPIYLQYTVSSLDVALLANGSPANSGTEHLGDGTNGIYGANVPSGTGTLQDLGGGMYSVTLPVSASFNYTDSSTPSSAVIYNYTLSGTLVATGTVTAIPEPVESLGVGVVALVAGLFRRRKKDEVAARTS